MGCCSNGSVDVAGSKKPSIDPLIETKQIEPRPDGYVEQSTEKMENMDDDMRMEPSGPPEIDPSVDLDYNYKACAAHNQKRAKHGMPPVMIDWEMAFAAQQWAQKMSAERNMQHSEGDYGENLAMYSEPEGSKNFEKATDMWYDEIKDYDFKNPGFNQNTGHFTQLVWKECTKVGFGIAGVNEQAVYVCGRYTPAGNMQGSFEENVFPPI